MEYYYSTCKPEKIIDGGVKIPVFSAFLFYKKLASNFGIEKYPLYFNNSIYNGFYINGFIVNFIFDEGYFFNDYKSVYSVDPQVQVISGDQSKFFLISIQRKDNYVYEKTRKKWQQIC